MLITLVRVCTAIIIFWLVDKVRLIKIITMSRITRLSQVERVSKAPTNWQKITTLALPEPPTGHTWHQSYLKHLRINWQPRYRHYELDILQSGVRVTQSQHAHTLQQGNHRWQTLARHDAHVTSKCIFFNVTHVWRRPYFDGISCPTRNGEETFNKQLSPGAKTINVFWACLGAQLTICDQKWRNFVCSSMLSLRFVLSRVCVFLYSLGPRSVSRAGSC